MNGTLRYLIETHFIKDNNFVSKNPRFVKYDVYVKSQHLEMINTTRISAEKFYN